MVKKTRLWYVSVEFEEEGPSSYRVVVVVTDRDPGPGKAIPFRTITPTAAGRRYIRHNLARRLTEIFVGPDTDGYDEDLVEWYRKKRPVIRVLKTGADSNY